VYALVTWLWPGAGNWTVYAADAEAAIIAVTAPGQSLIVDMSPLDFIDCSSLSVLMRVQRQAWQSGGKVVLAAPKRRRCTGSPCSRRGLYTARCADER
jgi:hypothetical protein